VICLILAALKQVRSLHGRPFTHSTSTFLGFPYLQDTNKFVVGPRASVLSCPLQSLKLAFIICPKCTAPKGSHSLRPTEELTTGPILRNTLLVDTRLNHPSPMQLAILKSGLSIGDKQNDTGGFVPVQDRMRVVACWRIRPPISAILLGLEFRIRSALVRTPREVDGSFFIFEGRGLFSCFSRSAESCY